MARSIVVLLVFLPIFCIAQNNVIIQQTTNNQNSNSVSSNEYFINGISTRMDIGGVDVEFVDDPENYYANKYLKFTNYHNFPVTVIFEVEDYQRGGDYEKVTGRITLRANETKTTPNPYNVARSRHCVMIVRKL